MYGFMFDFATHGILALTPLDGQCRARAIASRYIHKGLSTTDGRPPLYVTAVYHTGTNLRHMSAILDAAPGHVVWTGVNRHLTLVEFAVRPTGDALVALTTAMVEAKMVILPYSQRLLRRGDSVNDGWICA
jgi:hypothetical protein